MPFFLLFHNAASKPGLPCALSVHLRKVCSFALLPDSPDGFLVHVFWFSLLSPGRVSETSRRHPTSSPSVRLSWIELTRHHLTQHIVV